MYSIAGSVGTTIAANVKRRMCNKLHVDWSVDVAMQYGCDASMFHGSKKHSDTAGHFVAAAVLFFSVLACPSIAALMKPKLF